MFKVEKANGKAILTIYGYVGGVYMDFRNVAAALDDISNSGYTNLDFHIHTPGGDVFDGNLICNFLANFKGEKDIYVDGIAASMGSIIIMSGTRIHIADNGFIMIHNPSGYTEGNAKQHIESAKLLRSIEKNFAQKLADRCKKTKDEISSTYFDGNDHWIDADEAISLGIADDKFTAINGDISFNKNDAAQMGANSLYNSFKALNIDLTQPENDMKNVNMKLNLKEDAPETEAVSAIDALELRATKAEAKLQEIAAKDATDKKAKAVVLVDAAIAEQRIPATAKDNFLGLFDKDFDAAEAALAAIPKRQTAKDVVNNTQDETEEGKFAKMGWDAAFKAEKMPTIKEKYPETYKALFKEKFGHDPE